MRRQKRLSESTLSKVVPQENWERSPFEKDRDRIFYSKAFRRLNGVTQVVSAQEGATYHNRLIHSIKVAQVGRRLSQYLIGKNESLKEWIDPDVVECACLAHDIGHPPFGHIGEKTLNDAAKDNKKFDLQDGFEGNAQNLRILTKTEVTPYPIGLDLTIASLQAIIKYPWRAGDGDGENKEKGGHYGTENDIWESLGPPITERKRTVESFIMEWADDVSYAIHDLTDFFRIGLIPLHAFTDEDSPELDRFCKEIESEFNKKGLNYSAGDMKTWILSLADNPGEKGPYLGTSEQRRMIWIFINNRLKELLNPDNFRIEISGNDHNFEIKDKELKFKVDVLKAFTRYYIINSYSLNTIQLGQKKLLNVLIDELWESAHTNKKIIPNPYREMIEKTDILEEKHRLILDVIGGFTDQQAFELGTRLVGTSPGSVRNPII